MNAIKVEVDKDYLSYEDSCFLCLQPVNQPNQDLDNPLHFLLKYLKISEIKEALICQKCGENLEKFAKLSNILEKVRLEMDYLLDSIKGVILNSNHSSANSGLDSVREMVAEKCLEQMKTRKPQLILERLDISRIKRERKRSPILIEVKPEIPEYSDDWWPDLDDVSISSYHSGESPEPPIINQVTVEEPAAELQKNARAFIKRKRNVKPTEKAKCKICSKTFCEKSVLKKHIDAVHLRLKPFKCPACLKPFFNITHMKIHMNSVHLGIQPYKCDKCISNLRRHLARAHNPNPQVPNLNVAHCNKCEKSFSSIKYLKQHESNVHSEKRFSCNICKKMFRWQNDLRRHIAGVHEKSSQFQGTGSDEIEIDGVFGV